LTWSQPTSTSRRIASSPTRAIGRQECAHRCDQRERAAFAAWRADDADERRHGPRTYDSLQPVPVDLERLVFGQTIGSALDPEMQMWPGRVPAVSDQADQLSHPDALPTPHPHRTLLHVRIAGVESRPDPQEDAVA